MANTVAQEQEAIRKAQRGNDLDRAFAIKELAKLTTTNNVLKALASAVEAGDASYMLETALAALNILSTKQRYTIAKNAIEQAALNHREWMIQARAQDIIWKSSLNAMIAACD